MPHGTAPCVRDLRVPYLPNFTAPRVGTDKGRAVWHGDGQQSERDQVLSSGRDAAGKCVRPRSIGVTISICQTPSISTWWSWAPVPPAAS